MRATPRLRRTTLAVGAVLLMLAGAAADTFATAPGANGPIVFRRYLGPNRTHGAIFVIAPDGTAERRITTAPGKLSDDYPDYAADGSFIALQRCGATCRIYRVQADATGLTPIGPSCAKGFASRTCSDNSYPAIAPDRKRIAFVHAFGSVRHDTIAHAGIYTMAADGSDVRRVTLPRSRTAEDDAPQWSPDGRQIVFVRQNLTARPAGGQAIFVVNADGSGLRRVTPWKLRAGDGPDWSPDGSQILFRSPESEDFLKSNLFTIHPDGSGLRQVTHAAANTKVYSSSFSPDGTRITLGMQGIDDQADVFTIGVDGSGLTPVTRTHEWDSAPDWGGTR